MIEEEIKVFRWRTLWQTAVILATLRKLLDQVSLSIFAKSLRISMRFLCNLKKKAIQEEYQEFFCVRSLFIDIIAMTDNASRKRSICSYRHTWRKLPICDGIRNQLPSYDGISVSVIPIMTVLSFRQYSEAKVSFRHWIDLRGETSALYFTPVAPQPELRVGYV